MLAFIKDCGIMLEPQEGVHVNEILEVAGRVEKEGYGYIFRSDHLLPIINPKNLDSPECWVSLGAIAARTKRIKYGSMVSPIGFRNPAVLARMARTVDSISPGRLQLGVGVGWYEDEYIAHGIEFPSMKVRKQQFHEALQIIRPVTQTGKVDFKGKYFSAHLDELPKPEQKIHMIIGGREPSIIRETMKYADEWNFVPKEGFEFGHFARMIAGGDRKIGVSMMGPFIVADDKRGLRTRVRSVMRKQGVNKDEEVFSRELSKKGWVVGTQAEFAEQVNGLRERGVQKIYFQTFSTEEWEFIEPLASALRGT